MCEWLISPQGTMTQTLAMPFVLGAAAGLVAGIVGGTLVEFVLKMIFENDEIAREFTALNLQEKS